MENSLILFVEDNPDDARLTLKALRLSNIVNETVLAADGVEALDFLFGTGTHAGRDTSILPRFILLDLKLPKVDGLEVIRRVRADERTRLIPIVVLTASGERRDILDSYRLGANAYIRKPVDFVQFVDALRHTCEFWLLVNEPLPPQKKP
ncbi:MAG: response regulator [Armatimonadota bacterium]